jgi:hypothetical protein
MVNNHHCFIDGAMKALDMFTQDNVHKGAYDEAGALIDVKALLWK